MSLGDPGVVAFRPDAGLLALEPMRGPPGVEALEPQQASAYLERLGMGEGRSPTLETLRLVHRAHVTRVPFENLDIHLGVPIPLDARASAEKLARRSRGGFCYELNGALAALLAFLGFEVELLEARVFGADGLGGRFGHLALSVRFGDAAYLTDVGFGRGGFDEPLPFGRGHYDDAAGSFELREADGGALDLACDGALQYRVVGTPRALMDFQDGCTFHQTSPDSGFTRGTVCSIRTAAGRVTLAGTLLIETTADERSEQELSSDAFGRALRERFGVALCDVDLARLAQLGPSSVAALGR
jgi:N-hydroxyarylamine O-acetyltransferase